MRSYIGPSGAIWDYMGLYGALHLGLSGVIWGYIEITGAIWGYLGPSGVIWGSFLESGQCMSKDGVPIELV